MADTAITDLTPPTEGRPEEAPGSDILMGMDGNAFAIMGATKRALRQAGASKSFMDAYIAAATSGNYDHLLAVSAAYLDAD